MARGALGGSATDASESLSLLSYALTAAALLLLLLIGSVAYGLQCGLLSLSRIALEIKAKNSYSRQQAQIRRLLALLAQYHRVYVALLLLYVLPLETVPIVIAAVHGRIVAGAVSLVLLVCVAHSLPMAWFTGSRQVARTGKFDCVIRTVLWGLSPVVTPVAWVLDGIAKRHESKLTVNELKKSLFWHSEAMQNAGSPDLLSSPQLAMLQSFLDCLHSPVLLHMLPMDKVFSLTANTLVCDELLEEVYRRGFSRMPLREAAGVGRVLGVVHVASLIAVDRSRMATVTQIGVKTERPLLVPKDLGVASVLLRLLESGDQMAIIVDQSDSDQPTDDLLQESPALGIITQSDLMSLALKTQKTSEVLVSSTQTPLSSVENHSTDSLSLMRARRKGPYTAFDYEDTHSQEMRGSAD